MTLKVRRADVVTADIETMFNDAHARLLRHRGGVELFETILADDEDGHLLESIVMAGQLWIIEEGGAAQGFAIVRGEIIEALFVTTQSRRRGVARALLEGLLSLEHPPRDAYALPGDRVTKSLYESIGWKARLLTMRGG